MKLMQVLCFGPLVTRPLYGLLLAASTLGASDVSGDWEYAGKYLGDVSYARLSIQVEGEKLTGHLNELSVDGTIHGDEFSFTTKRAPHELHCEVAAHARLHRGCTTRHQSFRTGFLGSYGGNMDYNQIQEGTTVYLP